MSNCPPVPPQTDADPEVCKRMCKADDYENVHSLVSYYQMVWREKAQRFFNHCEGPWGDLPSEISFSL